MNGKSKAPLSAGDRKAKPVAGTASLSKGLQVLLLLGEGSRTMRFTELSTRLGLGKGTLHRILAALGRFDLVRFDPSEQVYVLGPRLLAMAHSVWGHVDVRGVAVAEMDRLAEETGELVGLAQLDGDEIIVIDQKDTEHPLGVSLSVGRRDPAYCTAAGKIMLAYQPTDRRARFLERFRFEKLTDATITDPGALEAELELCRARGYAVSDQEQFAGVRSVAAPIFSRTGEAVAAIFVAGPTVRLDVDRLHVFGRNLMKVAQRITGNLGGTALHLDTPPAVAPPSPEVSLLHESQSLLGDSPYWSVRDQLLYWVDILKPSISRMALGGDQATTLDLDELVGFVLDRGSGGSVIATQSGILGLDFDTGARTAIANPGEKRAQNRFNDGKCDRRGRLWAGTMNMDVAPDAGKLYRLDSHLRLRPMVSGITISNGLAWSPDDRVMYFADSGKFTVYAYDYDIATGEIANRRVFFEGSHECGRPSGITADAEGGLWCAMWDGWSVIRLVPEGKVDRTVVLPVPRPTSCVFAGDELDLLVVTTARIRLSEGSLAEAPLSGGIFALKPDVCEIAEVPFDG